MSGPDPDEEAPPPPPRPEPSPEDQVESIEEEGDPLGSNFA